MTHNATSLILQGSTNLATAAGDIVAFISEGSGNWREVWRRLAVSTSPLIRAGGNTTEATTTSTTEVDLMTVSSLNISTVTPIFYILNVRKTAGAAAVAALGLKLNTTIVGTANTSVARVGLTTSVDEAAAGNAWGQLGARVTNYFQTGTGDCVYYKIGSTNNFSGCRPMMDAAAPNATITDFIIRAINGSSSITNGVDELHVYSYPIN